MRAGEKSPILLVDLNPLHNSFLISEIEWESRDLFAEWWVLGIELHFLLRKDLVDSMDLYVSVLIPSDQTVKRRVQNSCCNFLRLGKLVLVDLHKILPHVEFGNRSSSSIENI